jgi:hypothetical protein
VRTGYEVNGGGFHNAFGRLEGWNRSKGRGDEMRASVICSPPDSEVCARSASRYLCAREFAKILTFAPFYRGEVC